jgi:hypothetical protein
MSFKNLNGNVNGNAKVDSLNSVDHSKHESSSLSDTNGHNPKLKAIDNFFKAQNTLKGSSKVSIPFNKFI